jgi:hypothetical protein
MISSLITEIIPADSSIILSSLEGDIVNIESIDFNKN